MNYISSFFKTQWLGVISHNDLHKVSKPRSSPQLKLQLILRLVDSHHHSLDFFHFQLVLWSRLLA